jgi:gamma-glutamylcyclotransferase (GGCT)/AIG2-like uncharacterized protein YtfP
MAVMTISLFSYGTLEIPEVMAAVTGRSFDSTGAVLPDHARFLLHGETYPGVIHSYRTEVTGVLYRGVDRDSLALLDLFEGEFYRRRTVHVRTAAQRQVSAEAYLVPSDHELLLSQQPWQREVFVEQHLNDFLAYCRSFHGSQTPPPRHERKRALTR